MKDVVVIQKIAFEDSFFFGDDLSDPGTRPLFSLIGVFSRCYYEFINRRFGMEQVNTIGSLGLLMTIAVLTILSFRLNHSV